MNEREILERASKILESRGWCKGTLMKSDGSVCLAGAIQGALGWCHPPRHNHVMFLAVAKLMANHIPEEFKRIIPTFNDHPDTTYEDVQLVLKKAIGDCP